MNNIKIYLKKKGDPVEKLQVYITELYVKKMRSNVYHSDMSAILRYKKKPLREVFYPILPCISKTKSICES